MFIIYFQLDVHDYFIKNEDVAVYDWWNIDYLHN